MVHQHVAKTNLGHHQKGAERSVNPPLAALTPVHPALRLRQTIGNRALLVAYAWPENSIRYQRLAKFVHEFFSKIDQFNDSSRHPKWREINIAAEMPGWIRFKPAAEWLAENRKMTASKSGQAPASLKQTFEQFVAEYAASKALRTTVSLTSRASASTGSGTDIVCVCPR